MKIILINSPLFKYDTIKEEETLPPLGLGYIASYLQTHGIEAILIDAIGSKISYSQLKRIINDSKPNFLGINIFSSNYRLVKDLMEAVKFKTHIIIGGPAAKSLYHQIIRWNTNNPIDVVIGDGELITKDIVTAEIKEKSRIDVPNRRVFDINYKSGYFVKDVSIFLLNREFFCNEPAQNHQGLIEANIVTSRGCIYNCAFCGAARSLNKEYPVRERSMDSIIEELISVRIKNPDVKSIRVLDDLFLKSKTSIIKAIEIFSKFDFQWRAMAHIKTFTQIDIDLLKRLKESGCTELFIGIESGSSRILDSINKANNGDLVIGNIKKIFKAGINIKGYFILGLPDETLDDMKMTYNLACELKRASEANSAGFRTSVFQFRPYHGTLLYKKLKARYSNQDIDDISPNNRLTHLIGRKQFNFQSKNYSKVSTRLLHDYICKTNLVGK